MPSPFTGLKELASRIGLRGLCTYRAEDMASHPLLSEFWHKVAGLCEAYYMRSMADIRNAADIQEAATSLFETYAPDFWKRPTVEGTRRHWLYAPGQGSPRCTPYVAELFYDNEEDRELLRTTIVQLITEKILRKHKDQSRQSLNAIRQSSEASFGDESGHLPSTFQCFGHGFPIIDHLNATWLYQQGVWMGDYEEEKATVNGASFDEITARYFDDTTGGTASHGVEPVVLDIAPQSRQISMQCKACAMEGACGITKADLYEFDWTDADTETTMLKHVWTFPCNLNGRKVFALLKQVPDIEQKRTGSTTPLFHFWKIDGGYTKTVFLSKVETRNLALVAPMRQTRSTTSLPLKRSAHFARKSAPTTGSLDKGKKRARDSDISNGAAELFRRIRAESSLGDTQSSTSFAKRARSSEPEPRATAQHGSDWDSLYDVTPQPDQVQVQTQVQEARKRSHATGVGRPPGPAHQNRQALERETEISRDSRPAPPSPTAPSIRARSVTAPAEEPHGESDVRFDLWVSLPDSEDYKIVKATSSLPIEGLFAVLQKKFSRILDGKEVVSVSVAIPNKKGRIVIEKEDADEWATVMSIVKSDDLEEVHGTVEAES